MMNCTNASVLALKLKKLRTAPALNALMCSANFEFFETPLDAQRAAMDLGYEHFHQRHLSQLLLVAPMN
jgi:hypothetical protein